MDLCEFLDDILEGNVDLPEAKILVISLLLPARLPINIFPSPVLDVIESLLKGDEKRKLLGSFFATHIYAYKLPLKSLEDKILEAIKVYKNVYERCEDERFLVLLSEAYMHLGFLSKTRREAYSKYSRALKILKSVETEDEGYFYSLGFLHLTISRHALRLGRIREAMNNASLSLSLFMKSREKHIRKAYDVLMRSAYLLELEKAREYAEKLSESVPRIPPAIESLALGYLFTGYEELYDKLLELKPPPSPILELCKAYARLSEDRDEGIKRLAAFSRYPNPIIASLALIGAGRLDVNLERSKISFLKAFHMGLNTRLYDLSTLSLLEAKKKGIDENTLESMRKKLREAIKRDRRDKA